jgi:crossover junction endodeoxyribonuclease RusA
MKRQIAFVVHGEPAPQGSKRHVGGGRMIESSRKVAPWRQDVVAAARAAMAHEDGWATLDGPLGVEFTFTLRKPASAPKKRITYPDRKPDLSKLVRSTEDALVTAGLIADDARIVAMQARKVFPHEHQQAMSSTGAWIRVWQVGA